MVGVVAFVGNAVASGGDFQGFVRDFLDAVPIITITTIAIC